MNFEEIVKKFDFYELIIAQKFPEEEIWKTILCFSNNEESYLKDKIGVDKSNTNKESHWL